MLPLINNSNGVMRGNIMLSKRFFTVNTISKLGVNVILLRKLLTQSKLLQFRHFLNSVRLLRGSFAESVGVGPTGP